jgi:transcriptional regulator with XRE-family HTH domain
MNQINSESHACTAPDKKSAQLFDEKLCTKEVVGKRIAEVRNALGLTQKGMSSHIGMALPSFKDYEGGKTMPGGEAMQSFIRAGINANWLLTGEGPMLLKDLQKEPEPAPALDAETLATAIQGLEEALEVRGLQLAPAKKARAIGVLYDFCKKSGQQEPGIAGRILELMT